MLRSIFILITILFLCQHLKAEENKTEADNLALAIFKHFKNSNTSGMYNLFITKSEHKEVWKKQGYSVNGIEDKQSPDVTAAFLDQIRTLFKTAYDKKIDPAKTVYLSHTVLYKEKSGVEFAYIYIKLREGMKTFTIKSEECPYTGSTYKMIRAPRLKQFADEDSSFQKFALEFIEALKTKNESAYKSMVATETEFSSVIRESTFDPQKKEMLIMQYINDSVSQKNSQRFNHILDTLVKNKFDLNDAEILENDAGKTTDNGIEYGDIKCRFKYSNKQCHITDGKFIKTTSGWKIAYLPEFNFW